MVSETTQGRSESISQSFSSFSTGLDDARSGPLRRFPGSPPGHREFASQATTGHLRPVVPILGRCPLSHHGTTSVLVRQTQCRQHLLHPDLVEVEPVAATGLQRRNPEHAFGNGRQLGIRLDFKLAALLAFPAARFLFLAARLKSPFPQRRSLGPHTRAFGGFRLVNKVVRRQRSVHLSISHAEPKKRRASR